MKLLITGVAGFVGSTLAERLLKDGHQVVGIDSLTSYYSNEIKKSNIQTLITHPQFEFHQEDLLDSPLDRRLDGVQVVFHQAGQPGVRKSWGKDFTDYVDWNILASQKVLEACKAAINQPRVVYASSSSIYGNATTYPTTENDLPLPISPYGVSKLAAEHLMSLYAENYGLTTVSLRYFTVYGPKQRPDMAFTRFVTAAQTDQIITIFGDGSQVRDFTYVDDVVEANILAGIACDPAPGAVFNVAGGSSISVNEVLETVAEIHGQPLNIKYVGRSLGDAIRTGGATQKISDELGWHPNVSVDDGLAQQYKWASKNLATLTNQIAD
ncbi:NAD-dependent epimerase/dehydratase family protein [Kocuria rhizosphaericola]|uniref:NAD-dependent epimerase/dehydratase family protein n=1 Tax=Kocuria rhizosphaericola TaxID=3376284 RepID=UPI0037900641